jgi:glutathione S-transferase
MKTFGPCFQPDSTEESILEGCKEILEKLATWMADKQWIAGDDLTWLDFALWEILEFLNFLSKD